MFDNLITFFSEIVSTFESIWLFLWSFVKFIVFAFKTIFNLIRKAFTYIFSDDLFNSISDTFQNLVVFMGVPAATALMSLFVLSILLIIISFIFKMIKWNVNYRATVKKYLKK